MMMMSLDKMEADGRWKESDDEAHTHCGLWCWRRTGSEPEGWADAATAATDVALSLPISSLMALMSDRMLEVALTCPVKPPDDVTSTSTLWPLMTVASTSDVSETPSQMSSWCPHGVDDVDNGLRWWLVSLWRWCSLAGWRRGFLVTVQGSIEVNFL